MSKRRKNDFVMDTDGFGGSEGGEGGEPDEKAGSQGLGKDWGNVMLLILLYTLQGIPMGLSASIPYVLQERTADFNKQAVFSLVSWPFSVKLLWAPIVDSVWHPAMGRRKTWLVPLQLLIAVTLFWSSTWVDAELESEDINIWLLTYLFLGLYTLCATQDIAVDGWALTMLSKENVSYASICNSIGQSAGYYLSFIFFLMLSDVPTCNSYFRSEPSDEPLVTLGGFMLVFGFVFLATTIFVWVFKREKADDSIEDLSIMDTYRSLGRVLQLPSVQRLVVMLLTMRVAFSCTDSVTGLKLQEYGVSKESLAGIGTMMFPLYLAVPSLLGKLGSHRHPLDNFLLSYPVRLGAAALAVMLTLSIPHWISHDDTGATIVPWTAYLCIFALTAFGVICSTVMFTSQMQFFCVLSDPALGGSYMTLLNTISNLGGVWPNTLSMKMVGVLEACEPAGHCTKPRDGYLPVALVTITAGVVWYAVMHPRVRALKHVEESDWRVSGGQRRSGAGMSTRTLTAVGAMATVAVLAYTYLL
eukprot:m.487620 g.487620  ORF g.487620 m.487620 type:complete len:528 (-) comp25159_c0_seq1:34-1617(-)